MISKGKMPALKAPFPYFGGKSWVCHAVWPRFGAVRNYVEPFFGSGAMLLGRPQPIEGIETVNDADGFVSNFWRAVQADPERVAHFADWPVIENDLHARHAWLVERKESLQEQLEGDPEFFDAKVAGWWCWGLCCWIGSGFCSGNGPWSVVDGRLVKGAGRGVERKRPHLGDAGKGVCKHLESLFDWIHELSRRLRGVRVCCGDWSRVVTNTPTVKLGLTAVFLDPPYADTAGRDARLYRKDCLSVAHDVREWAIANGDNPKLRIALCGYEGEHDIPETWERFAWSACGGMASAAKEQNGNRHRERIWF